MGARALRVGKVALSADTYIPTYRHPLQEGLRHLFFCFSLLDVLCIHQAIFLPCPQLTTPPRLQVFLGLASLLVLWFISKSCSGGWCPAYRRLPNICGADDLFGGFSSVRDVSVLGNPLLSVWLPVAVWCMCVCLHNLCDLSHSLFLPL